MVIQHYLVPNLSVYPWALPLVLGPLRRTQIGGLVFGKAGDGNCCLRLDGAPFVFETSDGKDVFLPTQSVKVLYN